MRINEIRKPLEIKQFGDTFDSDLINTRIQSQAARKNPAWKKFLVKSMKNHGFSLVGNGVNGAVFQNSAYPFVLKVYRTDHGYDEWLYFCRSHQHNKFVPKVKGSTVRLNKIFNAVRLEPLVPCEDISAANDLTYKIETLKDATARHGFKGAQEIWDNEDQDLIEIMKFLRIWEVHSDLSAHNVMCRSNGQMVLIDPLYIDPTRDNSDDW